MITIDNPKKPGLKPIEVEALADSGATYLCLPEHIANQLQLEATSKKEVTTADGSRKVCSYVGPVHVTFENRECYLEAVPKT